MYILSQDKRYIVSTEKATIYLESSNRLYADDGDSIIFGKYDTHEQAETALSAIWEDIKQGARFHEVV